MCTYSAGVVYGVITLGNHLHVKNIENMLYAPCEYLLGKLGLCKVLLSLVNSNGKFLI